MKQLLSFIFAILTITAFGQVKQKENLSAFLPKGYVIFEKIYGDLNKDNLKDCILIIKATDKTKIVIDDYEKKVDRNRRGLIVLLNRKGKYEIAVKNYNCFSSENEDGGVYMPPDLSVEIKKNNLCVHYGHGRYGYWRYTFRFQNSDFELIGYDSGDRSSFESDYVTFDETSMNFITKKELVKKVIKVNTDGKEVFKETWKNINISTFIKLSKIKDFDELDMDI
jgi:hypothetical protein